MYNCELVFFILVILIFTLFILRIKGSLETFRNPKSITLKVKTARDRQIGLMYVKKPLKENHGLLFDYGKYVIQGFWMKNTYIPLDIIYLDHKYKVLDYSKNLIPKSEETIKIDKPFRYAIEVNAKTIKKNKIKKDDYIKLVFVKNIN
tara:strand:- start:7936 stop:8379 length:444 start_codon:yes stop_codon:yes gene_type:complete